MTWGPRLAGWGLAWSVHLLTAAGAGCGLLALVAAHRGEFRACMIWMAIATAIDGVDGTLARRWQVRARLPTVDGARLDDLVDYLNYAVVPAFAGWRAGLLPVSVSLAAAVAVCVVSALQFARADAKTDDHLFTGFPSYWNVVVVYGLLARPPEAVALVVVALLCVLTLVPVRYVYPSRTPTLRGWTVALSLLWAAAMVSLILDYPQSSPSLLVATCLYPFYYVGLSLALTVRRRR